MISGIILCLQVNIQLGFESKDKHKLKVMRLWKKSKYNVIINATFPVDYDTDGKRDQ